jgi:antirestriction protein ArdC
LRLCTTVAHPGLRLFVRFVAFLGVHADFGPQFLKKRVVGAFQEELIAEMTAAMLCGIAGIEQKTLENSAAYLKIWITRLKSDSRLVVSAASQSQKAADFIQGKTAAHREAEA